ncbi:MAG: hypothetical protein J5679_01175 [Alphaproteobacteria bacterium]|nr:hypothetical protein [Alphaproteobacteria bacterium]
MPIKHQPLCHKILSNFGEKSTKIVKSWMATQILTNLSGVANLAVIQKNTAMTQQKRNLSREEKQALNNYAKERRRTSNYLCTYISRILCRDRMIQGFVIGLFVGGVFGGLNFGIGASKIRHYHRDNLIKTQLQQKQIEKKLAFSTMMIVTMFALLMTLHSFKGCREIETYDLQTVARKLTQIYFKKIFGQEQDSKEMANRAKHAAALIITNMPNDDLEYMRVLAIAGLSYDKTGRFVIDADKIEVAQDFVIEYLETHPEIQRAVIQIMNNEKIQTYVLSTAKQKTK